MCVLCVCVCVGGGGGGGSRLEVHDSKMRVGDLFVITSLV